MGQMSLQDKSLGENAEFWNVKVTELDRGRKNFINPQQIWEAGHRAPSISSHFNDIRS